MGSVRKVQQQGLGSGGLNLGHADSDCLDSDSDSAGLCLGLDLDLGLNFAGALDLVGSVDLDSGLNSDICFAAGSADPDLDSNLDSDSVGREFAVGCLVLRYEQLQALS